MDVISLDSIEKRVKKNSAKNAQIINNFQKNIERRGFRKGRQRPRNKTEQKILDSFERK